jgi:DNA polymerase-3 subunit gamma/tau
MPGPAAPPAALIAPLPSPESPHGASQETPAPAPIAPPPAESPPAAPPASHVAPPPQTLEVPGSNLLTPAPVPLEISGL